MIYSVNFTWGYCNIRIICFSDLCWTISNIIFVSLALFGTYLLLVSLWLLNLDTPLNWIIVIILCRGHLIGADFSLVSNVCFGVGFWAYLAAYFHSFLYLIGLISFVKEITLNVSRVIALCFGWMIVTQATSCTWLMRIQAFFGLLISYILSLIIFFEWLKVNHFQGVPQKFWLNLAISHSIHRHCRTWIDL